MRCKKIFDRIEQWAPREAAWERDNVGLQVGSADREVKKILLALDLTEPALKKALEQNCSLIITHHPLIFNPLKKIDTRNNHKSRLIEKLIKNNITLYSAHTNLDYTRKGVSFVLAEKLGLNNLRFLSPIKSTQSKIVVFTPSNALEKVSDAIFGAGGGIIGEYSECSFRSGGKGTFRGSDLSNPAAGVRGKKETVDEVRLEIVAENWKINPIMDAVKKAHPYEEPAVDIYPVENMGNYGIGAVGELDRPISAGYFLNYVSDKLKIKNFRYSGMTGNMISKIAVCGGSGSEYINDAINAGADAFITADLKYHAFQEAEGKILLVDAGHYETEIFALDAVQRFLKKNFKDIEIIKFTKKVNPVIFYNKQGA